MLTTLHRSVQASRPNLEEAGRPRKIGNPGHRTARGLLAREEELLEHEDPGVKHREPKLGVEAELEEHEELGDDELGDEAELEDRAELEEEAELEEHLGVEARVEHQVREAGVEPLEPRMVFR